MMRYFFSFLYIQTKHFYVIITLIVYMCHKIMLFAHHYLNCTCLNTIKSNTSTKPRNSGAHMVFDGCARARLYHTVFFHSYAIDGTSFNSSTIRQFDMVFSSTISMQTMLTLFAFWLSQFFFVRIFLFIVRMFVQFINNTSRTCVSFFINKL